MSIPHWEMGAPAPRKGGLGRDPMMSTTEKVTTINVKVMDTSMEEERDEVR